MNRPVGAVILAAGSSSRMGTPKQALQFRNVSFVKRSSLTALDAGCSPVIVVTGANAEVSRSELRGLEVIEALNEKWDTGMGSSICEGIKRLVDAGPAVSAAVLMLCDQPHVSSDAIGRLISEHRASGAPIVASSYGKNFGPPALFERSLFDELARLDGTNGAKSFISGQLSQVKFIALPEGEMDVDTPEDYERLIVMADQPGPD